MDEAGGDERQGDGDIACIRRDEALRDGLIDERLVLRDEILGRAGHAVDPDLLWGLDADVPLAGLVDGVELEVDHDLAAAVDQVGQREVDCGERALGSAEEEVAGALFDGELLDVEDLADEIAELVHLLRGHAGNVDGLLQLALEVLTIFRRVLRDEDASGVERHGEEMRHAEQERDGSLVGDVLKIEAQIVVRNGVVEDCADAIPGEDAADDILRVGTEVEGLWAGVRQERDGTGERRGFANPGFDLGMEDFGGRAGFEVLGDDAAVRVEEASFGEEGVGFLFLPEDAGGGGLPDEFGYVLLVGDGKGHGVVVTAGVELERFGELRLPRRGCLCGRGGGLRRDRRPRHRRADAC